MRNVDRVLAVLLGVVVLLSCGACSQPWQFARAELPIPDAYRAGPPSYAAQEAAVTSGQPRVASMPSYAASELPQTPGQSRAPAASSASYRNVPTQFAGGGAEGGPVFESAQGPIFEQAAPFSPDVSRARPGFGARLRSDLQVAAHDIRGDYRHYYSWNTAGDLMLGVATAAVPANTSIDEDFQSWYQRDVRSSGTDNVATFWKPFGKGEIFVPAYLGLALVGGLFKDQPLVGGVGEFSYRVTRGYLVGAPPLLLMQSVLGASRPGESSTQSRWKPFNDDNAVSGHAFIGAVPFITAAKMAENPWVKATLYTCSTFPAWSRLNDDAHYLSQVYLGWWMAYLASRAVDDTEYEDRCFALAPVMTPQMTGVGFEYRR